MSVLNPREFSYPEPEDDGGPQLPKFSLHEYLWKLTNNQDTRPRPNRRQDD